MFRMSWILKAGATFAVAGVAMINAGFFNPRIAKATLPYLSKIQLKMLNGSGRVITASELWQKNGAVIMVVRRAG